MATGILSVDAASERLPVLSDALLAIALALWIALWLIVGLHAFAKRAPRPRLESFAAVAATAVLGSRFAFSGLYDVAIAFWALAIAVSLVLLIRGPQLTPPGGGWLLIVVATESLAVLSATVAPRLSAGVLYFAVASLLAGLALYPLVIAAIAVSIADRRCFTPDLWVAMGALAITTFAEAKLFAAARTLHAFAAVRPAVETAGIATWAIAAAWILPLAVADARARAGWHYNAGRWSFVFPLGMFTIATKTLGRVADLPTFHDVAIVGFVVALIAWMLTAAGLARTAAKELGLVAAPRDDGSQ